MVKRNTLLIAAMAPLVAAPVCVNDAQAKLWQSRPECVAVEAAETAQVVASACADCCGTQYSVVYRQHHPRRKVCCGCCVEPYTTMLQIKNPCSCSPVEVPVCVPGCCTEPPSVSCRAGLFGRSITEFTWCCGYRVRIVLTRDNTIIVHSYGA